MEKLDDQAKRIVRSAAIMGRRIDNDLVGAACGLHEADMMGSLRAAVDVGLIVVEEGEFRFRHALTVDAVLAGLLPPELRQLSRRAADAIEAALTEPDALWCVLAGDLRAAAGQPRQAACLLLTAGRRALAGGAVAGAAVLLAKATEMAAGHPELQHQARLCLLEAVAATGDAVRADEVASALLATVAGEAAAVTAHLLVARAHLGTGAGRRGRPPARGPGGGRRRRPGAGLCRRPCCAGRP